MHAAALAAPSSKSGAVTPQQKRAALIAAGVVAALGVVLLGAGVHFRAGASAGAPAVSLDAALDRRQVAAGSFVTVEGTPTARAETYGDSKVVIFALKEQPSLVLVCPSSDATCASSSGGRFTGRVYDGGEYDGPYGLPMLALDQFAKRQHLDNATLRVINLGERPDGDATSAAIAFSLGGLLLVLGVALVALVKLGVLPKAPRAAR